MEGQELIDKIKQFNLTGRGGAAFPVADKWQAVLDAKADKKYLVINGEEGEPATHKDYYILKHHLQDVINAITLAIKTIKISEAYFYLKPNYLTQFGNKIRKMVKGQPIKLVSALGQYRGGEETMVLQIIEKKRIEPRTKPPFPTVSGLWGAPTVINNIETLWAAAKIFSGQYQKTRLYTLSGAIRRPGVYEASEDITIHELLSITKNNFKGETFAQVGGGAAGILVPESKYNQPIKGCGTVVIHKKSDISRLLLQWSAFFQKESCGRCVPCREGTIRLYQELKKRLPDRIIVDELTANLEQSSFCGLGKGASMPFCSGLKNQIIQFGKLSESK